MRITSLIFGTADTDGRRSKAVWAVSAWFLIVLFLMARHVFWRDEVRALSLALQGDDLFAMLRGVRGEGHPAIWYLMLRGLHTLVATPLVLPALSVAVALAAAAMLAFRSPFALPLVVVFLLGRIGLYEYAVMSRNYGISLLLMFVFAALYPRYRDRGVVLGGVLFLLANTNVHSVMLAGALMLFWLIDIVWPTARFQGAVLRNYVLNAVIAGVGVVLCVATVYPPFNDAAQVDLSGGLGIASLAKAIVLPAISFGDLMGYSLWSAVLEPLGLWRSPYILLPHVLMSVLLIGSTLGLVGRPAAWVAALVALLGLSIFFTVIYPGGYRHQALWVVFLMSLYWIAGRQETPLATPAMRSVRSFGLAMFGLLLVLQLLAGLTKVIPVGVGYAPEGRSRDLAALVASRPELKDATVIGDPDYLVEPLAYYMPNRTYLMREGRFGNIVIFTRKARLSLGLDDILGEARKLRETTRQPVIILLNQRLDPAAPARVIKEGYNWELAITPEATRNFLSSTRRIESFGKTCCSDETYDVYVLD